LQAIQATLARLTTGNNQRREDKRVREDYREHIAPAREHNPIPRRQLAYEEEISDDEEYAERILRPNRQGYHNMVERWPHSFRMKMDLPSFNGQLQIEGFLDWLVVVERFFDYMEIPEDKKSEASRLQINGRSLHLVGTIATHTDEAEKRDSSDLVKDEATAALQVFATRL
jgi:hypothetical protein